MDVNINKIENDKKLSKSFSNMQKVRNVIKNRVCIWNCCFCPKLQFIDCCNSCEIDIQTQVGL
jgi:hypothetical protein